jgi:hypothetical protein
MRGASGQDLQANAGETPNIINERLIYERVVNGIILR